MILCILVYLLKFRNKEKYFCIKLRIGTKKRKKYIYIYIYIYEGNLYLQILYIQKY